MAVLKIVRSNEYAFKLRNYGIYLDGKNLGKIAAGEEKTVEASPGTHRLVLKFDYVVSTPEIEFQVTADETKVFEVGTSTQASFNHPFWARPSALVALCLLLVLVIFFGVDYQIVVLVSTGMLLFYYLILGRSYYLSLHERPD